MGEFVFDDLGYVQRNATHASNKKQLISPAILVSESTKFVAKHPWYYKIGSTQKKAIETAIKLESKFIPNAQMR